MGGSKCLRGCLTTETSDHAEDRLHRVRTRHLARQRPCPTLPCDPVMAGTWRVPRHRAAQQDSEAATGSCLSPVLASGPLSTCLGGGVCHHLNAVCVK